MEKLLFNIIRLKIMSTLISVETCDFNYLLKVTDSTKGNLSIQLKKLAETKHINVKKCLRSSERYRYIQKMLDCALALTPIIYNLFSCPSLAEAPNNLGLMI